jgi:hypothetical protein
MNEPSAIQPSPLPPYRDPQLPAPRYAPPHAGAPTAVQPGSGPPSTPDTRSRRLRCRLRPPLDESAGRCWPRSSQ